MGWRDIDWGDAPGWFGGLSLVLALTIFMRDRSNAMRAQLDRVALSPVTVDQRVSSVVGTGVATAKFTVRNGSDRPIHVAQLALVLRSTWVMWVKHDTRTGSVSEESTPLPGTKAHWICFDAFDIAAQDTWSQSRELVLELGEQAPEGAYALRSRDGVECDIAWLLVSDDGGRRWEVHPGIAPNAKRIRWYSRPKEGQPLSWFSRLMRRFIVPHTKVRLTTDQ